MLKEKAGNVAGIIWNALNGTEGLTQKQIKKAATSKLLDKDFFLGLGWLLREDKVVVTEITIDSVELILCMVIKRSVHVHFLSNFLSRCFKREGDDSFLPV